MVICSEELGTVFCTLAVFLLRLTGWKTCGLCLTYSVTWIWESCRDRSRSILYPGLVYFIYIYTDSTLGPEKMSLISECLISGSDYHVCTLHVCLMYLNPRIFLHTLPHVHTILVVRESIAWVEVPWSVRLWISLSSSFMIPWRDMNYQVCPHCRLSMLSTVFSVVTGPILHLSPGLFPEVSFFQKNKVWDA